MRYTLVISLAFPLAVTARAQRRGSAPAAALRAAYLATNPAPAVKDASTHSARTASVSAMSSAALPACACSQTTSTASSAIIVPQGNAEALAIVNHFIDDLRRSGFLRSSIERSGVVGIAIAPRAP